MATVRAERPADYTTVFEINRRAFPTDAEAHLVDRLRREAQPVISLVAERDDHLAGHILFTPVAISGNETARAMGLAPMAVLPEFQRQGIGTALVEAGLEACRKAGYEAVVVLGHQDYYPRFGFVPATDHDLHFSDSSLDPYFFVLPLIRDVLASWHGSVQYHAAFQDV